MWETLRPFAEWVGRTPLSLWLGQSTARIASLFIVHLLGLTMFLGTTLLLSLRLLGAGMRRQPARALFRELGPLNVAGLALMLCSGALIFAGGATAYFEGEWFRTKMEILAVALVFRFTIFRIVMNAEEGRFGPILTRLTGLVSAALWLAVAVSGRAIAYFN